ncbi:hypothetical protein GGF49_001689 [Coemansia sp. RSA 1853]|nr:hypothetical protein LPJ76_001447 [Coemansia sp. RSA 638]KAJ2543938.1 hypothetical protein GGF49_001689 [Coemansia sp. RSA 1853]
MRLSIVLAQVLAATAMAHPAILKRDGQEIEAEVGDSVSGGPAAVSNPNVNNGNQVDSSLVTTGGSDAGDFINNAFGNSITHINSNSANKDNIVINPTTVTSNGNGGPTANGDANNLGDTQNVFPGFRKRETWVTGSEFESHWQGAVPVYPGMVPYYPYPQAFYVPVEPQVNINHQNAAIVQNQA